MLYGKAAKFRVPHPYPAVQLLLWGLTFFAKLWSSLPKPNVLI